MRFNNRELQQMIATMMDWDLSQYIYRADGFLAKDGRTMIFNLNNAREFKKEQKTNRHSALAIENLLPLNIQNLSHKRNNTNKLVLTFSYDYRLGKFWKNPQKYIPLLQSACVVATPDFSLNPLMDFPEYLHNVYKNRWLGCLWQDYGILTILNGKKFKDVIMDDKTKILSQD